MKNRILIFLCLSFSMLSVGFGQAAITEGKIILEVSEINTEEPTVQQMLTGSTLTIQAKGETYRCLSSMMGDQIQIETFHSDNGADNRIYLNLMGQKIMTHMPVEKFQEKSKEAVENSIITYDDSDTKEINGFTCRKALVETLQKDGSVLEIHTYVTAEIAIPQYVVSGLPTSLEGFPLEYRIKGNGLDVTYTFKEYAGDVNAGFFEETGGYNEMKYDEFMEGIGKQLGL